MLKISIIKMFSTIIIFSLVLGSVMSFTVSGFPSDKPAIVIEPPSIKDPTKTPGSTFSITVKLYNVTQQNVPAGLSGVEIHLTWNNTLIEPVSFTNLIGQSGGVLNPSILYGIDPGFYDELGNRITNPPYTNAKYFKVAAASTGNPWWGNGVIVTITFKVNGVGKCALKFTFTDLVDTNAVSVSHYIRGGCFDNRLTVPTAQVFIDPEKVVNSSLTPSNNFTLNIRVKNVQYLAKFLFNMSFNPAILEITQATWSWPAPPPIIDNVVGIIKGSVAIDPPFSGEAIMLTIKFHVKEIGESSFHLYDLKLLDMCDESIPFITKDGYFNNMLITKIFIEPSYRMDPNLRPGDLTLFSVSGENLIDIISVEFDLLYTPTVIKIIGYSITPIPGCLIDSEIIINNRLGKMHACINYSQAVSINHGIIMNVMFQVVGFGVSALDLENSVLLDFQGNSVTHQTEDGLLITVIRDIAVVEILPVPQKVYPGRNVIVYITVRNLGNISESFTVTAYVDGNLLGTAHVVDLPPASNATISFTWNTNGLPWCVWHSLSANVTIISYEFNIDNNYLELAQGVKIKKFGDINGDGNVDLSDLTLLARSYKKVVGDPLYNPDADIDGNGVVSLADMVTLARYYRTSC